jgi:predicted ATPase
LVTRQAIQFNRGSDYWLDVAAFRVLLGEQEPVRLGSAALEEGVALYRGHFLEGFGVGDSPAFEDWMLLVRERLQGQVLFALARLSQHYEGQGDLERAWDRAARRVELAPWEEQAHRQLMRLLAQSGRRAAALAQYETCRRTLRQELDVEPAAETTALYERIRDGRIRHRRIGDGPRTPGAAPDAGPDLAPTRPDKARGSLAPRPSLPAWLTPFVGREAMLSQIRERLRDPSCRLLSLVGPGGCGKTRLAVKAAAREVDRYPHGVFYVELAPLQSIESIAPTVAHALGLPLHAEEPPLQQVLETLRHKSALLLLDNFEHLVEGAYLVAEILNAAPGVRILVTSRCALHVREEWLVPVPGMNCPPAELDTASTEQATYKGAQSVLTYSAVQLFVQAARQSRPAFAPNPPDLAHVVEICRRVQGMPLAIVLAASWIRLLSPAEIAAQVTEHSLDFLEADWRDAAERQQGMRATFDYSWRLLDERERALFAALSVFRGGFSYEAARTVSGVTLRDMMALMDHSLLERATVPSLALKTGGRYQVHELLRQYGEEKLGDGARGQESRDRHAAYYMALLGRWSADLRGPERQALLSEIQIEVDNVRAAWQWAIACHRGRGLDRTQIAWLAQGLEALGRFYRWSGRLEEGEAAFQAAVAVVAAEGSAPIADRRRLWASALAWQAELGFEQRLDVAKSVELLRQSLALLEGPELGGCDVRRERAFALQLLGKALGEMGDWQKARAPLESSLALYRELGDRWGMAGSLDHLEQTARTQGDYDRAARVCRQRLELARELGSRQEIAGALAGTAFLASRQGALQEAERLIQESVALSREARGQRGLVTGLVILSWVMVFCGKYEQALAAAEGSRAQGQALGIRHMLCHGLIISGEANLLAGRYGQARVVLQQGLALAREMDGEWEAGLALRSLGELALAEGKLEGAWRFLQESVEVLSGTTHRIDASWPCAWLAAVALLQGDLVQARQNLVQALRTAARCRDFLIAIHALPVAALLMVAQESGTRAVELWALASRYPHVARSPFFERLVGQRVAALAAHLAP